MRWGFFLRQWKCSETGDGCTVLCAYEKAMNCALQNGCPVWDVKALNKAAIKKGDELAQLLGPLIYNELQSQINGSKKGSKKERLSQTKLKKDQGPAWRGHAAGALLPGHGQDQGNPGAPGRLTSRVHPIMSSVMLPISSVPSVQPTC